MAPILEVRDLQTHFFTRDGIVRAVDGVSFEVSEGEALAIVGESGCGKTVTALSIMQLVPSPPGRIVGGKIFFEGHNLLELGRTEMRRIRGKKIGMIFQDPMASLNPVLTIGRQIAQVLELHEGLTRAQARRRTTELLAMVGIPCAKERLDDYPHQFSGGMRQRVMIAMAVACHPQLVIADEPTTALDVTIQAQIVDLIRHLRHEFRSAVLWITHDLGVVAGLCDRAVVMYAGRVVDASPVRSLYSTPRHPYTLGLLQSIPRLDRKRKSRLLAIEGLPPDLIDPPPGCPFVERCPLAREACHRDRPPLRQVDDNHLSACWYADEVRLGASQ